MRHSPSPLAPENDSPLLNFATAYSHSSGRRCGQLLNDDLVKPAAGILGGDAQGVLDGPVVGATVANDANAVDAQKRGAAVLAVVVAVDEAL